MLISSHDVVVSVALDAGSLEITREALRLFKSLNIFGGELKYARKIVCISHDGVFEDDRLLQDLKNLNVSEYHFSPRYSLPERAPTLNKMCAFNPPGLRKSDYLLYLDADIVIAQDPLPLLSTYTPLNHSELLCGRPWNTFPNINQFSNYVGEEIDTPFFDYPPLHTISEPGLTYYGLCNSGMYFMRATVATHMHATALLYLEKSITDHHFRITIPYAPSYNGIDSVILWAAQYALQYTVTILSPRLNLMAPVEKRLEKYLHTQEEQDRYHVALTYQGRSSQGGSGNDAEFVLAGGVPSLWDNSSSCGMGGIGNNMNGHTSPVLIHFSRGSDLRFVRRPTGDEGDDESCMVLFYTRGEAEDTQKDYQPEQLDVTGFVLRCLMEDNVCAAFEALLRPYDDSGSATPAHASGMANVVDYDDSNLLGVSADGLSLRQA